MSPGALTQGGGYTDLSTGQYHSFFVRIWTRGPGGGMAYGRVTHVGSSETRAFRTLEELWSFLDLRIMVDSSCAPGTTEPS